MKISIFYILLKRISLVADKTLILSVLKPLTFIMNCGNINSMASKTYIQYFNDGTSKKYLRMVKQGRRKLPDEVIRTEKIVIYLSKLEKERFIKMQKESGYSQSFYGSIVLSVGIMQLSESDNCSTQ